MKNQEEIPSGEPLRSERKNDMCSEKLKEQTGENMGRQMPTLRGMWKTPGASGGRHYRYHCLWVWSTPIWALLLAYRVGIISKHLLHAKSIIVLQNSNMTGNSKLNNCARLSAERCRFWTLVSLLWLVAQVDVNWVYCCSDRNFLMC